MDLSNKIEEIRNLNLDIHIDFKSFPLRKEIDSYSLLSIVPYQQFWRVLDADKKVIASYWQAEFDEMLPFHDGFSFVRKGDKWGIVDLYGDVWEPLIHTNPDELIVISNSFESIPLELYLRDNRLKDENLLDEDGYHGLKDSVTGEQIVEAKFKSSLSLRFGLAATTLDGERWGFIDSTGQFAIPPIFDWAFSFSCGLAAVELDGKWGYITPHGVFVLPPIYDHAAYFNYGLAPVRNKDWKYGYIDREGNTVLPFVFNSADSFNLKMDTKTVLANISINGTRLRMTPSGQIITPLSLRNRGQELVQPLPTRNPYQ
ncbi:MAG: WG repeat-containing protein [Bacteroidales bacterium]|nr:WG repeat-containing protein [Bacteroidales bacterium]